jgi:uncharacterized membrane protein
LQEDHSAPPSPGQDEDPSFDDPKGHKYTFHWYLTLFGPFVLSALVLAVLYFTYGWAYVRALLLTAVAVFFFFGRFVILGGETGGIEEAARFFTPTELALLVFYMDTMVACLLAFHIGFVFRLPYLGKRLRILMDDGKFILAANPWMKRATFAGIVAFVMFPLAATGSVGGSIFGRLLGMSRLGTFLGAVTGSALGCSLMYFGAALINRYLDRDNPFLTIGGIAFVVFVVWLLNHRYQKMKSQWYANQGKNKKPQLPEDTNRA